MDKTIWLTPREMEEKFHIPAALTRRWARQLEEQGLARKVGYWLISPDAIPILKERVDKPGRVPIDLTSPDIRGVLDDVLGDGGSQSINEIATRLKVTWRTARKLAEAHKS